MEGLHSLIRFCHRSGISVETIARTLGMHRAEVEKIVAT